MEQNLESSINIPVNDIYKICFLDSNGKPNKNIVFNGQTNEITRDDDIFSDEEKLEIAIDQPQIISSKQQIHKDDTIRIIKKKIIEEIGTNNISYDELYLFSKKKDKLHLLKAFLEMTNQGKTDFDKYMAGQFLMNILNDYQIDKAEVLNKMNQNSYSYETFLRLLNGYDNKSTIVNETQDYNILFPIGRKFSNTRDYLFSANPFFVLPGPEIIYQSTNTNKLINFDNHLLLNYGDIINNTIFVCFAEDVLNFGANNNNSEEYLIELYFPLLKEKNILSKNDLNNTKEVLIEQTKQIIMKEETMKIYDIIDTYYDIYYSRKSDIPYITKGIKSFHMILHPEFQTILPLDIIFKQFHVNSEIPYRYDWDSHIGNEQS